jgi:molybdopterin synthase catalytic subunit
VSVVHRVGEIDPREPIVLVLVASAHRETAFAACELVMDLLKTEAVFWKKEVSPSGERWVESTERDRERAAGWRARE